MKKKIAIIESIQLDESVTVDEESGVIKNVRVLGSRSNNCHDVPGVTEGTEYTRTAMKGVLSLYEDATVYVNHNRKEPDAERPFSDSFGVLRENRIADDKDGPAVRANLHYNKAHPLAGMVVEDVKNKLGRCGLSHHAFTSKARVSEGRYVVESIGEVRSVDLVTRPATSKNLWESEQVKKHTLRQILEARKVKFPKTVKRLLEEGDMPIDAPMTDSPVDHEQALDDGFSGALKALVDSYMSGSLDADAAATKFKEILKAHSKIKNGDAKKDSEPEDKPAEPPADEEKKMESEQLKRENAALKCIIESGVKPTPILMKALLALDSDADRKELLKVQVVESQTSQTTVTSTVPNHAPRIETIESKTVPDVKAFAASIRE